MIITHHYIKHVLYVTSNRQLFSCNKPSDLNERVTVFLQVTMKKLNVAQYKFAKCCADVKKIDRCCRPNRVYSSLLPKATITFLSCSGGPSIHLFLTFGTGWHKSSTFPSLHSYLLQHTQHRLDTVFILGLAL